MCELAPNNSTGGTTPNNTTGGTTPNNGNGGTPLLFLGNVSNASMCGLGFPAMRILTTAATEAISDRLGPLSTAQVQAIVCGLDAVFQVQGVGYYEKVLALNVRTNGAACLLAAEFSFVGAGYPRLIGLDFYAELFQEENTGRFWLSCSTGITILDETSFLIYEVQSGTDEAVVTYPYSNPSPLPQPVVLLGKEIAGLRDTAGGPSSALTLNLVRFQNRP